MFIRGNHPESVIWHHFRSTGDGFVFGRRGDLHEARLVPNADRTVELFLACLEHLPPAVRVTLEDWRSGETWEGEDLATLDVRDAIARAKQALATHGGCEVSVVTDAEQVTLTANLELFVFAPTDRWLYLLQGKGLRRVQRLRRRSWWLGRGEFGPAEAAVEGVRLVVQGLRLEAARGRGDAGA